jgi:hypothetical protein
MTEVREDLFEYPRSAIDERNAATAKLQAQIAKLEATNERYREALGKIQFIGTKGTSKIWPDLVLKECVSVATSVLNGDV